MHKYEKHWFCVLLRFDSAFISELLSDLGRLWSHRCWLLMSLVYFIACTRCGELCMSVWMDIVNWGEDRFSSATSTHFYNL